MAGRAGKAMPGVRLSVCLSRYDAHLIRSLSAPTRQQPPPSYHAMLALSSLMQSNVQGWEDGDGEEEGDEDGEDMDTGAAGAAAAAAAANTVAASASFPALPARGVGRALAVLLMVGALWPMMMMGSRDSRGFQRDRRLFIGNAQTITSRACPSRSSTAPPTTRTRRAVASMRRRWPPPPPPPVTTAAACPFTMRRRRRQRQEREEAAAAGAGEEKFAGVRVWRRGCARAG